MAEGFQIRDLPEAKLARSVSFVALIAIARDSQLSIYLNIFSSRDLAFLNAGISRVLRCTWIGSCLVLDEGFGGIFGCAAGID